ncbi:hypothetical protein [Candidatus Aalborgicola defluviihabitans]|uniref:hypothetical protein n=1 Tax=Candidatus Aalborgicola defluviihabitans TaxID=3386187 RepID=UPI001D45C2F7|nr:hypothetical protein [Burkholderiales bacterium]MBK6567484.1 hypothetical protein [Burkholderiales bacterium]MBK7282472.1 hypothetical protein [Burkholderiales bacterium]MBL0244837.1 hypothetical protein [Rhodoferax sp.]
MLTLIAIVLISFGGFCVSLAFKKGYQTVVPLMIGVALIALGFYVLPTQNDGMPDVYYRK